MPPLPRAPLLLFAAFAFAAIGAEACGSSAPNDPAGGDSAPDGSSSGEDAANGPGRSDGSAADAGRGEDGSANDASHEGSVDAGSFGKYVGDDPCVTGASRAAAWTTQGRCSSCPARSPIVSSQTGTIAYSQTISSQGNAALGEPTFASDGTAYVSDKLLSALTPTTLVPKWTHGDYFRSPVVGPDGTLYVSATSPFHEITALDPTTGALKWKRNDFQEYLQRPTILANGGVALLLHASGTKIVVLDPVTGANSWSVALPDTGGEGSLVASVDGTIYATTEASGIFAVSSSTHAVLWNVPVTVREFALDERAQRLYFVAAGGGDKLKVGWMATSGSAPVFGAPFAVTAFSSLHPVELSAIALGENGWVYFSAESRFFGNDTTNDTRWDVATGVALNQPAPSVVGGGGTVYLAAYRSDGGYAMAFTRTGALLWDKLLTPWTLHQLDYRISGSALSIAPSGHLVVAFAQSHSAFWLGP